MKKFAFYSSGKSTRVIKFYEKNSAKKYKAEFILYDGDNASTIESLNKFFFNKVILPIDRVKITGNQEKNRLVNQILLENLINYNIDYLFCFGDKLLNKEITEKYAYRIINFHPSILPSFPGLNSIDAALETSVQILGNTAHFINEGIDTGLIIMQSAISRDSFTTYDDVLDLQITMLKKIWDLLLNDKLKVIDNKIVIENKPLKKIFYTL